MAYLVHRLDADAGSLFVSERCIKHKLVRRVVCAVNPRLERCKGNQVALANGGSETDVVRNDVRMLVDCAVPPRLHERTSRDDVDIWLAAFSAGRVADVARERVGHVRQRGWREVNNHLPFVVNGMQNTIKSAFDNQRMKCLTSLIPYRHLGTFCRLLGRDFAIVRARGARVANNRARNDIARDQTEACVKRQ